MSQPLVGVNLTAVRTSTEGPEFAVGTVASNAAGNKMYKYVAFNYGVGTVASAAGKFAYYYGTGATTVTMDLSDSKSIGAGVFQAVIATGGYGWIQTQGHATMAVALTAAPAAGVPLTPVGATDGTLDTPTAITDHLCAVHVDSSTAAAPIVFLTCPL